MTSWVHSLRSGIRSGRLSVFVRNGLAVSGGVLVAAVILLAIFGALVSPYSYEQMDTANSFASPSGAHLLGTDQFGRDVLSRLVIGARASLFIAASGVAGALLVGGVIALLVGYFGGVLDLLLTRLIDVMLSIPALLIAIGVVALLGPSGTSVAVALTFAYSPTFARVIRSSVVSIRNQTYVEASRGLGVPGWLIIGKDVIPNVMPVVTVQVTASLAWGILDEANLGFLGLGVQPPTPSWGSMLIEGRVFLFQAPWIPIFVGLAVMAAVFGFNLLGDGLRDVLDPRSSAKD